MASFLVLRNRLLPREVRGPVARCLGQDVGAESVDAEIKRLLLHRMQNLVSTLAEATGIGIEGEGGTLCRLASGPAGTRGSPLSAKSRH